MIRRLLPILPLAAVLLPLAGVLLPLAGVLLAAAAAPGADEGVAWLREGG